MKKLIVLLFAMSMFASNAKSQEIYVRSNALWDAALMPNIGAEVNVGEYISIGVDFYASWLGSKQHKTQGWMPTIEGRYYFKEMFGGHHVGVTLSYYNINKVKYFYSNSYAKDGYSLGAGVLYGYSLNLAENWNVSFNIGVEISHTRAYSMQKVDGEYIQPAEKTTKYHLTPRAGITFGYKLKYKLPKKHEYVED